VRCVVGYFRISREDSLSEKPTKFNRAIEEEAAARQLPMQGVFMDLYDQTRCPPAEFHRAVKRAQRLDGLLIIPALGETAHDPGFLEALHNAEVPFRVLDRPDLHRDNILADGLVAMRADRRA
jgi:hypothetical protein